MSNLSHQEDLRLRIIINVVESISGSVSGIGYTQNGEEQVNSASFTIPAGSGSKSGSVYLAEKWYVEM